MKRLILLLLSVAAPVHAQFQVDTVVEGLDHPWSVTELPDRSLLITERTGQLRAVRDGKLIEEPIAGVPAVYFSGQGGLLDVELDPGFAENRTLYISYAHGTRRSNALRIMRAKFDGETLTDQQVIFTVEPAKSTSNHFGGRMAFLGDGTLLATTGDGVTLREHPQRLDSLLGKIVRITRDGEAPSDNPFVGQDNARPEIWSYGHRNPQALLRDPESGRVWMHEHGPRGGDEINLIEPGRNYGWPAITYGRDYTGAAITPYTEYPGMEQPVVDWTPSIAPSGMAILDGDLLVTALKERSLRRVVMNGASAVEQQILLQDLGYRLRDVAVASDGTILVLTDRADAKLLRITPAASP